MKTERVKEAVIWKLFERIGFLGIQFIIQIILARILEPSDFGAMSIMVFMTTISQVFVNSGLNMALIQNKQVDEGDYSSVFYLNLLAMILFYIVLYCFAPWIGAFYRLEHFVGPFRVLAAVLPLSALSSVQLARLTRQMQFKRVFVSSVSGIVVSGIIGIYMALHGFGLWALVTQQLINQVIVCIAMGIMTRWYPKLVFRWLKVRAMLSFSWKLLVASLLDSLYSEIRGLIIGKKYDAQTLGYYSKGTKIPQLTANVTNGTLQSVMLPVFSSNQDDPAQIKNMMRKSIRFTAFIVTPIMAGMAVIARPLVLLLLTEKWAPCIEYLQISCAVFALYSFHPLFMQAFNAIGRSGVSLKVEALRKATLLLAITLAALCTQEAKWIVWASVAAGTIGILIDAIAGSKLYGYTSIQMLSDIANPFILSALMMIILLFINYLNLGSLTTICLQLCAGIILYLTMAWLSRSPGMRILVDIFPKKISNHNRNKGRHEK